MLRKKCCWVLMAAMMTASLTSCGDKPEEEAPAIGYSVEEIPQEEAEEEEAGEGEDGDVAEEVTEASTIGIISGEAKELPAGTILSEMTGEPIDASLAEQRPVAVMVDNETTAYPHFGVAEGDVMYEIMNSTLNGGITRLMVMVKDWGPIKQMGSIRSTRPTNILLASEWNAVLCHDGGPYYNDQYFKKDYAKHFSGTFSRVNNGKPREFTEYVVAGDLDKNFSNSGYSVNYDEFANEEPHFNFVEYGKELDFDPADPLVQKAENIDLAYIHTKSKLQYNESTKTYDYITYGSAHKDAEDGEVASYKNVLLQNCTYTKLDDHGYLIYNCISPAREGLYITNGYARKIYWIKPSETGHTVYIDENGEIISLNTGKTYVSLIPDDQWDSMTID